MIEHVFQIGDIVTCKGETYDGRSVKGDIGRICCYSEQSSSRFGVRWDNYFRGHSCDGNCDDGHGWYVNEEDLELIAAGDEDDDVALEEAPL